MDGKCKGSACRTYARLSYRSAYGARSLCKYQPLLEEYPQATVVATAKAFVMMKQFFGNDYADRRIVASEMSELSLRCTYTSFCDGADGALARGYGYI